MISTYREWKTFCLLLKQRGILSVTAAGVLANKPEKRFVILKHDVETNVKHAYEIAAIEAACGHHGSYYVQAYLLYDEQNINLLRAMQEMGHEISYHYDVMDACGGDLGKATDEFSANVALFEENGFSVETVCQHGNPIIERNGYTSNRDFFRSECVQEQYPHMTDIMVDFPQKAQVEYNYFSDAGRQFKQIYDPLYNDVVLSDDKNVIFDQLSDVLPLLESDSAIVSIHPHRWFRSSITYFAHLVIFRFVKALVKLMIKIPLIKRAISRYYYLAKKI